MIFNLHREDPESALRELQDGLTKLTHDENTKDFILPRHWSPSPFRSILNTSNLQTLYGFWAEIGKLVFIDCSILFDINSGTSTDIYVPLPVKPSDLYFEHSSPPMFAPICAQVNPGSAAVAGNRPAPAWVVTSNGGEILVRTYDESNWPAGTSRRIRISGHYWKD